MGKRITKKSQVARPSASSRCGCGCITKKSQVARPSASSRCGCGCVAATKK